MRFALLFALLAAAGQAFAADEPVWLKLTLPDGGLCGLKETSDGNRVWVMDEGGLKQFDTATGDYLRSGPHIDEIRYGDPAELGDQVLTWNDHKLFFIDKETGELERTVVTNYWFDQVAVCPADRVAFLKTGFTESTAVDIDTGQHLYGLSRVPTIAPDGSVYVRSGPSYKRIHPRSGLVMGVLPVPNEIWGWGRASNGDQWALTWSSVWHVSLNQGSLVRQLGTGGLPALSADGHTLYQAEGAKIRRFNTATWVQLPSLEVPDARAVEWKVYRLYSCRASGSLWVFDTTGAVALDPNTGASRRWLYEFGGRILFPQYPNVGTTLHVMATGYSSGTNGDYVQCDALSGKIERKVRWADRVDSFVVSPDGTRLTTFSSDGHEIAVYSLPDLLEVSTIQGYIVALAPNGTECVDRYAYHALVVRSVSSGQVLRSLPLSDNVAPTFAWSQDGQRLLTVVGRDLVLFDYSRLKILKRVRLFGANPGYVMAASADCDRAIALVSSKLVAVDLVTGVAKGITESPINAGTAVCPDGNSFVWADEAGLKFWSFDLALRHDVPLPNRWAVSVRYSDDGQFVYASSDDGFLACFRNPMP